MSYTSGPGYYKVEAKYADLLRSVGLIDGMSVFEHPDIEVWRSITERENCVLDHAKGRLHIKRDKPGHRGVNSEVEGLKLLQQAGIKTVPIVASGMAHDGRGFFISDDLAGYEDSEKLVAGGLSFDRLLLSTAQLAARLHRAGLHHRDLYLCHFYARAELSVEELAESEVDIVLMDAGRVAKLPWLLPKRWIVKDLAQFIYSTQALPVSDAERGRWLSAYAEARGIAMTLRGAIDAKVRQIAVHDAALRRRDPTRNVAIAGKIVPK
ncbi:MAG: hypothetical protein H7144_16870 [Burkholderiales bacterium]|nr:hypothetical protein [Phycisphaerae bacterium]